MVYIYRWLPLICIVRFCEVNWAFTPSPSPTFTTGSHPFASNDRRRVKRRQLYSSSSSSKNGPEISTTTQVVYQKVVRPSKNLPDLLFLGYLVEYLERNFELPSNLPMIYESLPGNEETRCILAWDSPLSPSPEATRMEVEVVGIYTDRKESAPPSSVTQPSAPQLAMVVVRKAKSTASPLPPMMLNLFQDSEKKILKSLDRGLEDFISGKIKFQTEGGPSNQVPKNVRTVEEAIEVELMDSIPRRKVPKIDAKNVVFDAYATEDRETSVTAGRAESKKKVPSPEKIASAMATMNVKAETPQKTPSQQTNTSTEPLASTSTDYAVEAAKKKAATNKVPKPLEDYAVAAARRLQERKAKVKVEDKSVAVARKVEAVRKSGSTKEQRTRVASGDETQPDTPVSLDEFRIPDYMGKERAFRTTISRPNDRTRRKQRQQGTESENKGKSSIQSPELARKSTTIKDQKENEPIGPISGDPLPIPDERATKGSMVTPSREQLEIDVIKAAHDVMDDLAKQGVDMTPEDLLRDVLKFGEETEKENTAGNGFVSAAFDKAKELLREQHLQRQAKESPQVRYKERKTVDSMDINPSIASIDQEELSAEEELRRMFEAGERIAEGRITRSEKTSDDLAAKGTTEDDIDNLIARDRTISKYARSLDDEMTELEVAINASPGEEFDGPRQNPIFDIFSGPEVYNRNAELDTVNYPGAMPGTKNVNLPQELKEAIEQAEFAVEVLAGLTTIEHTVEDGTKDVKYFAGKRELTEDQVKKLETVAGEAIEIGLIRDPIRLVDESSRLQLLVDELWGQPVERFRDIAESYKDLLLSDNFIDLIKGRLKKMADRDLDALRRNDEGLKEPHERERRILGELVVYAQLLVKEARALGAELEAQQLQVIRSICQVAMDPKHQSEEETAMALSDAVRDMRPLLDESFVAYLKYAVAEEESRLARAGLVDDPEHNQWLFVLKIVQQGVYAEIAKSINRYIEHIWYVLRMETPRQRKMLLSRLIDDMPTLDVRPFVKVVENMVGALGDATRGEFDGVIPLGEMTNKLLQLRRDVKELLPPERIAEKSRDADEWAARQKERLKEARKLGKQRLKAVNDTAGRQAEIDDVIGRRGEVERFD